MSDPTMTSEQIELARRATTLTGWKWAPGMLVWGGGRITERTLGVTPGVVPDLLDPTGATDGALLRLLGPGWSVQIDDDRVAIWRTTRHKGTVQGWGGTTLAEACCRAVVDFGYWTSPALIT